MFFKINYCYCYYFLKGPHCRQTLIFQVLTNTKKICIPNGSVLLRAPKVDLLLDWTRIWTTNSATATLTPFLGMWWKPFFSTKRS